MRTPALMLMCAALAACGGGDDEGGGGFTAAAANAVCEEFNPGLRAIQVEELTGSTVPRERLAAFWERYISDQERQLDELRGLGDPPPGPAADYLARLERNVDAYRRMAAALDEGTAEPFGDRTYNSEIEARRLAESAGLGSCSPPERIRFTAFAAVQVEEAAAGP